MTCYSNIACCRNIVFNEILCKSTAKSTTIVKSKHYMYLIPLSTKNLHVVCTCILHMYRCINNYF